jgi:YHS domain-containing protein
MVRAMPRIIVALFGPVPGVSSMTISAFPVLVLAIAPAFQEKPRAETRPSASAVQVPFFGNEKCPVSGKDVDRTRLAVIDGQPVYFCCGKCIAKAEADPKATAAKAYPVEKRVEVKNASCPVMDDAIGDSKETVVIANRVLRLCCKDCEPDARANPSAVLAKALDPKLTDYRNTACPCGKPASGRWIVVYQAKIVRLCTPECIEGFRKDPDAALARTTLRKP